MNKSPDTRPNELTLKGKNTEITCIGIEPRENKREKGSKVGDATKITGSARLEVTSAQMPNIDGKVSHHQVINDGYKKVKGTDKIVMIAHRIYGGKEVPMKPVDKYNVEIYYSRIEEAREQDAR